MKKENKQLLTQYVIGLIVVMLILFGVNWATKHGYMQSAPRTNTEQVDQYPSGNLMGWWLNQQSQRKNK